MTNFTSITPQYSRKSAHALRAAVLSAFVQLPKDVAVNLKPFSEREWRRNLYWLDSSGLALYLFDHLRQAGLTELLPPSILIRLRQNLADNRERNEGLLAEAAQLNQAFQHHGILFANLKGVTLVPDSVPDLALRCQLDLDFLVLADHACEAARELERWGYSSPIVSGSTWEFKAGHVQVAALKDLYKLKPQRSVELHLTAHRHLLERVRDRSFAGVPFPVLAPVDQYVAQAVHLMKHLCSSFTRAAWLLEHRRHLLARRSDTAFWQELETQTASESEVRVALGVVSLLMTEVFGDPPPPLLARLIATCVPAAAQLWVRVYGRAALLADFPGTKLYLLLREQLQPGRELARRHLLPLALPPPIFSQRASSSRADRLSRAAAQTGYTFGRLRFHAVQGAHYLRESSHFRRLVAGSVR